MDQTTKVPSKDMKIFTMSEKVTTKEEKQQRKLQRRKHDKETQNKELFFDTNITIAEDERTVMAEEDKTNAWRVAIDPAHTIQELMGIIK